MEQIAGGLGGRPERQVGDGVGRAVVVRADRDLAHRPVCLAVGEPRLGERAVANVGRDGARTATAQPVEIDPLGGGSGRGDRPLGVERLAGVDLERHRTGIRLLEPDGHRGRRRLDRQRAEPDHVAQGDRLGMLRARRRGRRPRHLQVGDGGEDSLAGDDVVAQERLVAGERRGELLPVEARGVGVDERMHGLPAPRRSRARRALEPEALTRERIGRQRDAPRRIVAVEERPVDREPLDPEVEQRPVLPLRQPGRDHLLQIVVRSPLRELGLVPLHLAVTDAVGRRAVGEEAPELGAQIVDRGRGQRQAPLHRLAADLERVGEVGQVGVGQVAPRERRHQLLGAAPELLRRPRRKQDDGRLRRGAARGPRVDVLLEQHVGVDAAGTEGRDAGAPRRLLGPTVHRALRTPPRGVLPLDDERRPLEVDLRVELVHVQGGHELAVAHLEHDLGQSGDARGRLEMADVRLDRADGAEAGADRLAAEGAGQAGDLDRIAELVPVPCASM